MKRSGDDDADVESPTSATKLAGSSSTASKPFKFFSNPKIDNAEEKDSDSTRSLFGNPVIPPSMFSAPEDNRAPQTKDVPEPSVMKKFSLRPPSQGNPIEEAEENQRESIQKEPAMESASQVPVKNLPRASQESKSSTKFTIDEKPEPSMPFSMPKFNLNKTVSIRLASSAQPQSLMTATQECVVAKDQQSPKANLKKQTSTQPVAIRRLDE